MDLNTNGPDHSEMFCKKVFCRFCKTRGKTPGVCYLPYQKETQTQIFHMSCLMSRTVIL